MSIFPGLTRKKARTFCRTHRRVL